MKEETEICVAETAEVIAQTERRGNDEDVRRRSAAGGIGVRLM